MKYSVVWYSQQIALALGNDRLHKYARAFGYGNADFSGDAGKNNGLERAWIASSLQISPLEQIKFLENLVSRKLAVRKDAFDHVNQIVEITHLPDGWDIHAKTGTAYPRKPDSTFDESKAYGWFIGWANKGPQTFVFARLIQDERKEPASAGARARDSLMRELPSLLSAIVLPRERSDKHDWREEKCRRYKKAWASLLLRQGSQGLGKDFLETHDRFLTSNCEIRAVCPHSPEEFEAANNLVMLSMGFGTASTFPPFACNK